MDLPRTLINVMRHACSHRRRIVALTSCVMALLGGAALSAGQQKSTEPRLDAAGGALQPLQPNGPADAGDTEWTRWTSGRYRLTPNDVIDLRFPFVPELDQTLTVQPDGYVTLREIGDLRVQGRTMPQVQADLREAYARIVREPVFTVVLKEFEKPYFVIAGEVARPGRYDLRGATTLTQALAYAGGPTAKAKLSDVVIFRPYTDDSVTVKQLNVKAMYDKRDLSEDPLLRPGDTIFLSKSTLGKLAPVLSKLGLGLYLNPMDWVR